MTTPDLVLALGRIQARVYAIDLAAFGPGNDLVVLAVRTEVERIISEEVVKWLDSASEDAEVRSGSPKPKTGEGNGAISNQGENQFPTDVAEEVADAAVPLLVRAHVLEDLGDGLSDDSVTETPWLTRKVLGLIDLPQKVIAVERIREPLDVLSQLFQLREDRLHVSRAKRVEPGATHDVGSEAQRSDGGEADIGAVRSVRLAPGVFRGKECPIDLLQIVLEVLNGPALSLQRVYGRLVGPHLLDGAGDGAPELNVNTGVKTCRLETCFKDRLVGRWDAPTLKQVREFGRRVSHLLPPLIRPKASQTPHPPV